MLDKEEADIATRKNEFAIHKEELNKSVESDQRFTQLLKKYDYKTPVKEDDWVDYASEAAVRDN